MAGITGKDERAGVMAQLTTLVGGQVWKTQVPDGVELAHESDGRVKPYIIVRFSTPKASTVGRNIASGEQGQPHLLTFTVLVISSVADWTEKTMDRVLEKLVGFKPTATAGPLQARGGFSYDQSETGSKPTRFESAAFFRGYINV